MTQPNPLAVLATDATATHFVLLRPGLSTAVKTAKYFKWQRSMEAPAVAPSNWHLSWIPVKAASIEDAATYKSTPATETAAVPQRPKDTDADIADASEQIAAMLEKDESLTVHDAAVSLWIRASDERDRAVALEAQLSAALEREKVKDANYSAVARLAANMTVRATKAEAKRDRLRDALGNIVRDFETDYMLDGEVVDNPAPIYLEAYLMARAALTPPPSKAESFHHSITKDKP